MGNTERKPYVSGLPGPRDPRSPPAEQFNDFCREPPCASAACRHAKKCLHGQPGQ